MAPAGALPARLVALDVLRGVAVLLVVARHVGDPTASAPAAEWAMAALVRGGWIGVDLFFVLSGFLIAGLLFREHAFHGRIRVGRFLVRRGLKIYPPFYALLAITLAARLAQSGSLPPRRFLLGEALYLQNYLGGLWGHTWSLAVEEHFYLFLPLFLVGVRRRSVDGGTTFRALPRMALLIMVLVLALRIVHGAVEPTFSNLTHLAPTHFRIDGMLFGVLLAWLHHYRSTAFHRVTARWWPLLLAGGVAALSPAFFLSLGASVFLHTWGFTLFYLGAGGVVLGLLGWEGTRVRRRGVLATVGLYSYSIYLWHMPVKMWALEPTEAMLRLTSGSPAALLVFAGLSCVVGIFAAKVVEFPVLRLRDRFFPSRSGALLPTFAGEGMGPHAGPTVRNRR